MDMQNLPAIEEVLKRWKRHLGESDWYIKLQGDIKAWYSHVANRSNMTDNKKKEFNKLKEAIFDVVEEYYIKKRIFIGKPTENFDKGRKEIDIAVIHHSGNDTATTWQRISIINLLWVYCREFLNPKRPYFQKPIFSCHRFKGYETFIAYHYLISKDGRILQTLKDKYVGWHAGDWRINCRSIGICILGDYKDKSPSEKQVQSVDKIIRKYGIKRKDILGHREINPKTICPGDFFLGGWKKDVLRISDG